MDVRVLTYGDLRLLSECLKGYREARSEARMSKLNSSWERQITDLVEFGCVRAGALLEDNKCRGLCLYSMGEFSLLINLIYVNLTHRKTEYLSELLKGVKRITPEATVLVIDTPSGFSGSAQSKIFEMAGFEQIERWCMVYDGSVDMPMRECPQGLCVKPYNSKFNSRLAELDRSAYGGLKDEVILEVLEDVKGAPPSIEMVRSRGSGFDQRFSRFAFDDGKLVGAIYVITRDDEMCVANLAIRPEYQGCGLGGYLLSRVIRGFKDGKSSRLWLMTTSDERSKDRSAIGFYHKFNFNLERTQHIFVYRDRSHRDRKIF